MSGHFDVCYIYSWWVCRVTACASCRRLESRCCGNRCPRRCTWISRIARSFRMHRPQHDMSSMNWHEQTWNVLNNQKTHLTLKCLNEPTNVEMPPKKMIKMGPEEKTGRMCLEKVGNYWSHLFARSQSKPRWGWEWSELWLASPPLLQNKIKENQRTQPYQQANDHFQACNQLEQGRIHPTELLFFC